MNKISQFEMLTINGYVNRINKVALCDFIRVSYKKLAGAVNVDFEIYGKHKAFEYEETAVAFLDGIYMWASDKEK